MTTIRIASKQDIDNLSHVHLTSFKTTYNNVLTQHYLNQLTHQHFVSMWANIFDDKSYTTYIVETTFQVVGFITMKINDQVGQIPVLYLLESYQGKGIGTQLLVEAFSFFEQQQCNSVTLEVLDQNKAKYFYYKFGARLVSSNLILFGGIPLKQLNLHWDIPIKMKSDKI